MCYDQKGKENPFKEKLNSLDELDIWLRASDPQVEPDLKQQNGNVVELVSVRKACLYAVSALTLSHANPSKLESSRPCLLFPSALTGYKAYWLMMTASDQPVLDQYWKSHWSKPCLVLKMHRQDPWTMVVFTN